MVALATATITRLENCGIRLSPRSVNSYILPRIMPKSLEETQGSLPMSTRRELCLPTFRYVYGMNCAAVLRKRDYHVKDVSDSRGFCK